MLKWTIACKNVVNNALNHREHFSLSDKFDFKNTPSICMCEQDTVTQLNNLINKMEQGLRTQNDVDNEWCDLLNDRMYTHITYRSVKVDLDYSGTVNF